MFSIGAATHIYVAAGSTDMRKGFEGLFGLVRDSRVSMTKRPGAALHSFLYGVTPLDMQVFATTALVMFSVAVGAAAVPAIRASRLDPGAALRHE